MKKNHFLFLMLFVLSCTDEDPVLLKSEACFEYSPEKEIKEGDEITFTNCSENASTYAWDFGDGTTSVEENPTHIYNSDGNYTVTLVAINGSRVDTVRENLMVKATEVSNYLSFNGEKYDLDWGLFNSVSQFEVDASGRYHEVVLMSEGVSIEADEFIGSGNFINLTITTDASHVNNIVGDFSNKGENSQSALDGEDYSWYGVGLETINNDDFGMPYVDADTVAAFTISKTDNMYTVEVVGWGERETASGVENGKIEIFFKGELTQY